MTRLPYLVLPALLACTAAAHAQTCLPPGSNDWTGWLERQEAAGGHTLACHVGVSESGLIGRLENRGGHRGDACHPNGAAASAWSGGAGDYRSVIDAIGQAIIADAPRLVQGPAGDLVLSGVANRTIGRVVQPASGNAQALCPKNSAYECRTTRAWTAVLRWDGTRCYLLTAYPQ